MFGLQSHTFKRLFDLRSQSNTINSRLKKGIYANNNLSLEMRKLALQSGDYLVTVFLSFLYCLISDVGGPVNVRPHWREVIASCCINSYNTTCPTLL